MIDTEVEEYVRKCTREEVFKALKEVGIVPPSAFQTTLTPNNVELEEDLVEYLKDKQCLIWLGSNEKGEKQNVRCNQIYISKRGSIKVEKALPFSFEDVFNIWEAYHKGNSLEDIFFTAMFDYENVGLSDIRLVIWMLLHGKCNYMLKFIQDERYTFDFKKYEGRY